MMDGWSIHVGSVGPLWRTVCAAAAALSCAAAGAAMPALQVPVLSPPVDSQAVRGDAVRWEPAVELRFGEAISLLDTDLWLALEPAVQFQAGQHLPGGARAPFRLTTSLTRTLLSGPGRRPLPLSIPGPSEAKPTTDELPLIGPGMALVLWDHGSDGTDSGAPKAWAYVRVLEVSGAGAWLEVVEAPASVTVLERDPVGLEMNAEGELTWTSFFASDPSNSSATYRIERRAVGTTNWLPLAEGIGRQEDGLFHWVDASAVAAPPRVFEYRVLRSPRYPDTSDPSDPSERATIGAYLRAHAHPEGEVTVGPGSRLNLISGKSVGPDETAHVEVGRSSAGVLLLTPLDGVRFSRDLSGSKSKTSKGAGARFRTWRLPDQTDPSWLPAKSVALRDGDEVDFLLDEGLRGRLGVSELDASTWLARRRLALDGAGVLARAPGAPLDVVVLEPAHPSVTGVRIELPLPDQRADVNAGDVVFEVERESPLGSQRWTTVARSAPGASSIVVSDAFAAVDQGVEARPIARLRLRVGVVFGQLSGPGDSIDLLCAGDDDAALEQALDRALARIAEEDFLLRMEARAVLRALGERARPTLESLVQTSPGEPEGLAASELLREMAQVGGGARFRRAMRSNALESLSRGGAGSSSTLADVQGNNEDPMAVLDAWLGPIPPGLDAATVNERAHALLMAVDRAERGVASAGTRGNVRDDLARIDAWLEATSFVEADEGLRWLARFLLEIGLVPSLASFEPEAPAWLLPRPTRFADEPLDFAWGGQPATAEELRWFLESRPELSHRDLGPVLARLHASLDSLRDAALGSGPLGNASGDAAMVGSEAALFDYDARTAELVLRLVERVRRTLGPTVDSIGISLQDAATILAAAEALLPGERLSLLAARAVSDRRLASPSPEAPPGRTVISLEGGDLASIQAALLELPQSKVRGKVEAGADLVLTGGDWAWGYSEAKGDKGESARRPARPSFLEVRRDDVRIMANGDASPRLLTGIRVTGRNVVLEGIEVENVVGQAVTVLDRGHLVGVGSTLRGAGTVMHLQGGDAELYECRILPAESATAPATAARLILSSELAARATLFAAGSLFISSDARVTLDRCVLDSGERMLVQAQERGELSVRESLLRGTGSGLFRVSDGRLVGSVIDVPRDPLGRLPQSQQDGGLRISPTLFRLVQPGQKVPPRMKMETEPLLPRAGGDPRPR